MRRFNLGLSLTALSVLAVANSALAQGWGNIKGQVVWNSKDVPEAKKLDVNKDQQHCLSKGPIVSDELVIDKATGGVANVMVWLAPVTKGDKIPAATVEEFCRALESMVRMYEHHAAIEDTIVFPAWKAAVGDRRLDELGAKFEEIENESFGGDGFAAVQKRISEIEQNLGLANLDQFTVPEWKK